MEKSIEREIKDQYAKFFLADDWFLFKETAEYYLELAARLLKEDICYSSETYKLLRRNIHKRLYLGMACELLLKAFYLNNGYCINKKKDNNSGYPFKINEIEKDKFKDDDTLSLNQLISGMHKIKNFGVDKVILDRGLKIAKVFRNKEGHVAALWHEYNAQNYRDIEKSLILFYKTAFKQSLNYQISFSDDDKPMFCITKKQP